MIDYLNIENSCCGCAACKNICPVNAIRMIPNQEGFLFPIVDTSSCINCHKCEKVCQIEHTNSYDASEVIYAAVNKNDKELKESSSGGMFLAIVNYVIKQKGYVVGCVFDEEIVAKHIVTRELSLINQMCGSKYVQSDISDCYKIIKKLLDNNDTVLFTGTPCQVEALNQFLGKSYSKLITIDLICHGVPSPLLWKKHKEWLEKKEKSRIVNYNFRTKEKSGWSLYYYYRTDNNSIRHGISNLDPYYTDFLRGKNYRECCYNCKYANVKRCSDFTIGDYWHGESLHRSFSVSNGISLFIPNTMKAKKILNDLKNYIKMETTDTHYALKMNSQLVRPTYRPSERSFYYQRVFKDINKWEKDFYNTREWRIVKLKSLIPLRLKLIIKRLLKRK